MMAWSEISNEELIKAHAKWIEGKLSHTNEIAIKNAEEVIDVIEKEILSRMKKDMK